MKQLEGATCATTDAELFFPEQGASARQIKLAKKVCAECFVLEDCTVEALQNTSDFGIQAGMNPQERRDMRRELKDE